MDYYNLSANYMREVMARISHRFSPEDCAKMEEMLRIISEELMPEINIPDVTVEKN
jgi:hypothetical protein